MMKNKVKPSVSLLNLAYLFSLAVAGLCITYILCDLIYFAVWIPLILCVAVAAQISIFVHYGRGFSHERRSKVLNSIIVSVGGLSFITFDNLHAENELFFFAWGAVFGLAIMLFIVSFIVFYRIPTPVGDRGKVFMGVFIIFSLYSTTALKLVNTFDNGNIARWEQGTAYSVLPVALIIPGNDPDYIVFDNDSFGTRDMALYFPHEIKKEGVRVEVQVFKGRFGIPWFYKNYREAKSDQMRLIK